MNIETPASSISNDADDQLMIIDCDVHPSLPAGLATLFPLMPKPWVERFKLKGGHLAVAGLLGVRFHAFDRSA